MALSSFYYVFCERLVRFVCVLVLVTLAHLVRELGRLCRFVRL